MICTLFWLACTDKTVDSGEPDTTPVEETGDDTEVVVDDTSPPVEDGDWVKSAVETEGWQKAFGYEVATYTLADDAPDPYASLYEGEKPTFYVVRPTEPDPSRSYPVLAWFHGGTIGDDSEEVPAACTQENVTDFAYGAAFDPHFVPRWVADREWIMVIPRNDWCDAWQGMGPDDVVDPEQHFGFYHANRVMDHVREGGLGFAADGPLYGWGTSAGAHGVTTFAARYGGFEGIVFDSGLGSMFMYYALNDPVAARHIFGGDPYDDKGAPNGEIWQRYAEASPYWLVNEGGFEVPMFLPWNSQDTLVQEEQLGSMFGAITSTWGPEVRWGSHDYAHKAPGSLFHVQSVYGIVPWGYYGTAYMDFLEGKSLSIIEAEDGCGNGPPCVVGEVITDNEMGSRYAAFSQATGLSVLAGDAGVLYSGRVPSEVTEGSSVKATVAVRGDGYSELDPATEIAALQYLEGETVVQSVTLTVGDLYPSTDATDKEMIAQYDGTAVSFTAGGGTARYLSVIAAGTIDFDVDAILYTW